MPKKSFTGTCYEQIRRMHHEGMTPFQIGHCMNMCGKTVKRILESMGLQPIVRTREPSTEPKKKWRKEYVAKPRDEDTAKPPDNGERWARLKNRLIGNGRLETRSNGFWLDGMPITTQEIRDRFL